ncbi:hypothetical protein CCACVL1_18152 [Corchorus capsularis]|uniref:RNA polymerase II subunit A C-terminal domain phosphatase SSU72 n=1 Tax=Corchorus capsularis TaxID=210143 RepID=A0A1R3HMY0_COCAP|nr:hypothetical protein CCACVL1_18152 [Corchorus capsularis]
MKYRYAMVCSSNQNRSMEAHPAVEEAGVHIKLPVPSLTSTCSKTSAVNRNDPELIILFSFTMLTNNGCKFETLMKWVFGFLAVLGGFESSAPRLFAMMATLAVLPTVWLRDLSVLGYISSPWSQHDQSLDFGDLHNLQKLDEGKFHFAFPLCQKLCLESFWLNVSHSTWFIERVEELFQLLPAKNLIPDVVTWTSRIGAYSRKKLYTRCLEIFEEMVDAGCYPDGGTAKVLLSACSSEDQIEQVTTVIRTMHKGYKDSFASRMNLAYMHFFRISL